MYRLAAFLPNLSSPVLNCCIGISRSVVRMVPSFDIYFSSKPILTCPQCCNYQGSGTQLPNLSSPVLDCCNYQGSGTQYVVRFTTEDESPIWPFWLSARAKEPHATSDSGLRLELTVSYLEQTDVLKQFLARLPKWVSPSWSATVYQSVWEF